jgi:hypothetical protein
MDTNRFDFLARSLVTPSRRGLSLALAGIGLMGGLSSLRALTDAEARKKGNKKKKKCKKSQKKCGKTCIPLDDCCPACTGGRVCVDDVCECPELECDGTCIPGDGCCPACSSREICSFGFCICAPGTNPCGELCCVSGAEVCYSSSSGHRCLPT